MKTLQTELKAELLENILPFWMKAADLQNGGFVGQVNGEGKTIFDADKGCVLNARILWTFSAAYRILNDPLLRSYAGRAKKYLTDNFIDKKNGGVYWAVDYKGKPVATKKQIYALGFAIYGLSEHYRATGNMDSLEAARVLFENIEEHSFDKVNNGYFEAFSEDWSPLLDVRLSEKDANETKTMNTHLHILESYTNLYRSLKFPKLKQQIENLIELFLQKFINPSTSHLNVFFNDTWKNNHNIVSYGHDIETSWLLYEAAREIGNDDILERVRIAILKIADVSCEGLKNDGSMAYEHNCDTNKTDTESHWWVQAETVAGYANAYVLTKNEAYLNTAKKCWEYIKNNLIDNEKGEWYWSIKPDGTKNTNDDKLGLWKCPYHNARMCLEIIENYT